ncbi:MAG: NAD(P)-dependent alcohol dehydrogenase [Actinomycetota bacterium]
MRAIVCDRYGPPEVARVTDVPKPTIGPDEILVHVRASSVNRTDSGARLGTPPIARLVFGLRRPKHTILGSEFAGDVVDVGIDVAEFVVGDRVFGFDDSRFGGHGEYAAYRAMGAVAKIPDGVSYETAGIATEGAHYALGYLEAASVREGHDVLVFGATGAIGSAAVQLAVQRGARVTAVGDADKLDMVDALGAHRAIDRTSEDFTRDEGRYHLVFDSVGKAGWQTCRHLVAEHGWFMATEFGDRFENVTAPLMTMRSAQRAAFPIPSRTRQHVKLVASLLASGDFTPVHDRTYDMDDIVEAYRYVESGTKTGNVALRMG